MCRTTSFLSSAGGLHLWSLMVRFKYDLEQVTSDWTRVRVDCSALRSDKDTKCLFELGRQVEAAETEKSSHTDAHWVVKMPAKGPSVGEGRF